MDLLGGKRFSCFKAAYYNGNSGFPIFPDFSELGQEFPSSGSVPSSSLWTFFLEDFLEVRIILGNNCLKLYFFNKIQKKV